MLTALFLPPLLALGLIGGGAALIAHVGRTHRAMIAARVSMIAPVGLTAPVARSFLPGELLVRAAGHKAPGPALAEAARICRKLKINPDYAQAALSYSKVACGLVFAVATYVLFRHVLHGIPPIASALAPLIAGIVGWMVPQYVAEGRAKGRAETVVMGLPEALELLVVCVEAGLALEDSIDRITEELKLSQPVLAEELALTSADLKILPDRDIALHNLADRIAEPSVRSVVTTLSQTLRYGTPLAQALRTSAAELRSESLMTLEERANRLPTLLTVPMMLFILPTIFLIVGGPAVLRLTDILSHR